MNPKGITDKLYRGATQLCWCVCWYDSVIEYDTSYYIMKLQQVILCVSTANYPKRVTLVIRECVSESRTHNTFICVNEVKDCLPGYCLRIVQKIWRFFSLYRQKTTVNKTTAIFFFCPSFRLLYLFAFVFAIASVHSLSSRLVSLRLVLSRLFRLVYFVSSCLVYFISSCLVYFVSSCLVLGFILSCLG